MDDLSQSIQIEKVQIDKILPKVFRCVNCFKIPTFSIIKRDDIPYIKYSCECTLSEKSKSKIISILDFLENFSLIQLNSMICNICNHTIGEKNIENIYYCFTCKRPYCNNCINNHINEKPGHENMNINFIDDHCHIHTKEKVIGWCINCKINLCNSCCDFHKDCEIKKINDINFKKDTFDNYKKILQNISNYVFNKMKEVKKIMINKCESQEEKINIDNLYQNNFNINENLIRLAQHCINTYDLYQNKLIYPIIQNVKNSCDFNLGVKFNSQNSINDYKNYLKTIFITKFTKEESPTINLNEDQLELIMKLFNDIQEEERKKKEEEEEEKQNFNIYDEYVPIIHSEEPTETNIGKLKCIKSIHTSRNSVVASLIKLYNQRFALGKGKNIEIFNENNFQLLIVLRGHEHDVFTLSQLKDNTHRLVSGDFNSNIKFWLFNDTSYQCVGNITVQLKNYRIIKLIHLSNDKLAILTSQSIEIYEKDFPFEIKVQKISDREKEYISLLETSKKLLISSSSLGSLRLYNQEDLSIKKELKEIRCSSMNGLIEVKNDRIAIGSGGKIYVVNSITFKLEKIIVNDNIVTSLCLLYDNSLLVSEDDKSLKQYNFDTCELLGSIENANPSLTISCIQINNKYILTAHLEGCNVWEYKN